MRRFVALALVVVVLAVVMRVLLRHPPMGTGLARCVGEVAPIPRGKYVALLRRGEQLLLSYDDGLRLTVPVAPARIVSTLPGITESLAYLGGLSRICGVSPHCDEPPVVRSRPVVEVMPLDLEGILALEPDLVILDRRLHRQDLARVQDRLPSLLLVDSSRSLPDLVLTMHLLAEVLGTDEARSGAGSFEEDLQSLLRDLARRHPTPPPRALAVAAWDPLYVMGRGSLADDLLRVLGCSNVACDLVQDASGLFQEELVLTRRPDWILVPRQHLPDRLRQKWRTVPAVREERFLDGSSDQVVRAGPRILDGLRGLAEDLYGEVGSAAPGPAEEG